MYRERRSLETPGLVESVCVCTNTSTSYELVMIFIRSLLEYTIMHKSILKTVVDYTL